MDNSKILISRTDNIGDVVLTLPMVAEIKKFFPNCHVSFLARDYVRAVVENCPSVDTFLSWDSLDKLPEQTAIETIRRGDFTTILHVFPRKKIARLAKKAGIKNRIGTSRRLYHIFNCNRKVNFSRTKSQAHEAVLNFSLLKPLGIYSKTSPERLRTLNNLKISGSSTQVETLIDPQRFNLILHPLSNGNGRQWPLEHYSELIKRLDAKKFNVLVTGSSKEREFLENSALNKFPELLRACGQLNLDELLQLIRLSNGLIASGTGPLHLAAAIGIPTLGLFPPAPNINPMRWSPIGKNATFLVADITCQGKTCDDQTGCPCMQAISVEQVIQVINQWVQQLEI